MQLLFTNVPIDEALKVILEMLVLLDRPTLSADRVAGDMFNVCLQTERNCDGVTSEEVGTGSKSHMTSALVCGKYLCSNQCSYFNSLLQQ